MKLIHRYITKHFFKNFFILLFGMSFAVVLIDMMQHFTSIKGGANAKILYLFYRWESAIEMIYPIVIVLSLVMTKMSFIKDNTLVALYSFGYKSKEIFRLLFISSLFIYLIFIALQFTKFSYSKESADAILHHSQEHMEVNELFFKYDRDFVYVKELDPVKKILHNAQLFVVSNGEVNSIISFKRAKYIDGRWRVERAKIKTKKYKDGKFSGYDIRDVENIDILEGYKPKVVKLIYEGHSLTLLDGLNAYRLLKLQNLATDKIKALLYNKVIMPIFALALMTILFFKIPSYQRFMRRELVWAFSIGATLIIWGLLHALFWLASSGVVLPDLAQPPFVLILSIYAIYLYIKER